MTIAVVVKWLNHGRLGVRQPDVYGKQDLETLRTLCAQWGSELGLDVEVRQSDDEAEMIGWMHQAADEKTPVVMNPAAFTHYSYGLADAAHMVIDEGLPLMEVHISNPSARDEFRKRSVISPVATGTITGMGFYCYTRVEGGPGHCNDQPRQRGYDLPRGRLQRLCPRRL